MTVRDAERLQRVRRGQGAIEERETSDLDAARPYASVAEEGWVKREFPFLQEFVVIAEGELVGRVSVRHSGGKATFKLGVLSDWKEERVAQTALQILVEHLEDSGISQLWAHCGAQDTDSAEFLQSCGFEEPDASMTGTRAFCLHLTPATGPSSRRSLLSSEIALRQQKWDPSETFEDYVEHPLYGKGPRITGWNPIPHSTHWRDDGSQRVPFTAIKADEAKLQDATVPISHYFDFRRTCIECDRPFLFFAEEQRYWYEELGFPLDADCVRCVPCRTAARRLRRGQQEIARLRSQTDVTPEEVFRAADVSLLLFEKGVIGKRALSGVRALLNRLGSNLSEEDAERRTAIRAQIKELESREKGEKS